MSALPTEPPWGAGDEEHVPHGVFRREDFPRVEYRGEIVDVSIPRVVYDVLTRYRSRDVLGRALA